MLTELIAVREEKDENGNGLGLADEEEGTDDEEEFDGEIEDDDDLPSGDDPGAVRRFRFRHPTASGKTIAAAGFVEAARTMGILILTHRRLLVSQFTRDLTTEGYGSRFEEAVLRGQTPKKPNQAKRTPPKPAPGGKPPKGAKPGNQLKPKKKPGTEGPS